MLYNTVSHHFLCRQVFPTYSSAKCMVTKGSLLDKIHERRRRVLAQFTASEMSTA